MNLPVEALQSTHCKTQQFSQYLHTRHCCNESVSSLVSVVFVYKSLKVAALLANSIIVEE